MSDEEKPKTAAEWKEYFLAKGYGGAPVIKAPRSVGGGKAGYHAAKKQAGGSGKPR